MTSRMNRHRKNSGGLKALLLAASVIATVGGARLLELQEPVGLKASSQTVTVVEPEFNSSVGRLPQSGSKTTLELKPIPQVVVPRFNPVARAHSSM